MNTFKKAILFAAVPLSLAAPSLAMAVPVTSTNGQVLISQSDAATVKQVGVADVASFVSGSESGADAFVKAAPGQSVTVMVTPSGCEDDSCKYQLTTSTPATIDAAPATTDPGAPTDPTLATTPTPAPVVPAPPTQSLVAATGTSVVKVLSTSALPQKPQLSLVRGTPTIYTWRPQTDHVCSWVGCIIWKMELGSKAYSDHKVAWAKTRYNISGSNTCNARGTGISVDQQACGFRNDPSANGMYAEYQAKVYAYVKGFPIHRTCYLHRHYPAVGSSWLVTHCA